MKKRLLFINLAIILFFLVNINFSLGEIINERTEKNDTSYVFYASEVFPYYDGSFRYFDYMVKNAVVDENKTVNYYFREGNYYIKFEPLIWYNNNKYYVKDLPQNLRDQLNYNAIINRENKHIKFDMALNVDQDIQAVGFKLDTNIPYSVDHYNYTPSGNWDLDEVEDPTTEVYDVLFLNKYRLSFNDLLDSGYNIQFNPSQKELYIDLRNTSGYTELDPTTTFYSHSSDGQCNSQAMPWSCVTCTYTATTQGLGINKFLTPNIYSYGYTWFNTSILNETTTINSITLKHYVQSRATRGKGLPTENIGYGYRLYDFGNTLTCSDVGGYGFSNNIAWGSTGWKSASIPTSHINKTGTTSYRIIPSYTLSSGQLITSNWRTNEYGSNIPELIVDYTPVTPAVESRGLLDLIPNVTKYPFIFLGKNETDLIILQFSEKYPIIQLNKTLNITILPNIVSYPVNKLNEVRQI